MGDAPPTDLTHAVYANSEGNPFFVVEIMNHVAEAGLFASAAAMPVNQIGIPQSVRESIVRRLGRLSPACNRLLSIGAVLGQGFELDVAQDVAGLSEAAVLDAVDEGLAAGLLAQPDRPADQCGFTHALVREALYSELTAARRAHLHRQVAGALGQRFEAGRERYLAPLAYHLAQAADASNASLAVRYARLAAQRASEQLAHEEAVRFYELALRVLRLTDEPDEVEHCELLLAIGRAQARAGDGPAAGESFQAVAALAREQGRPDLLGEAALGFGAVRLIAGFVDEPLIALLRSALDALPPADSSLRARLTARLTSALYHSVSHEELMALSAEAVAMARRLNDPATLLFVLLTVHVYRFEHGDLAGRLAASEELVALAEATGDREAALRAHRARVIDLLEAGDADALDEEMRVFEERAYQLRQPLYIHLAVIGQAMRALLDGRFEDAERLAGEALAVGQDTQSETGIEAQAFAVQLFGVRKEQGRLAELEGVVRQMVDRYPALPSWQVALAHIHSETGNLEAARSEFQRLAQDGFADLPEDFNRPIALALLAETCAALGDAASAAPLYDLLLPLEGRCAVAAGMSACIGAASRHLGLLAATMRRWQDAERHFADALEMNRRLRSEPLVAHVQQEWAAMLLARRDAADRPRALALLREAETAARTFGLTRLAAVTGELIASAS
jgi:tetratricopeptide (TPR) repeat protein